MRAHQKNATVIDAHTQMKRSAAKATTIITTYTASHHGLSCPVKSTVCDAAIGSVGEMTAASANATASGIAGMSQWISTPTPSTVKTTRPSAKVMIVGASRSRSSLGMRQPSRKCKGGIQDGPINSAASSFGRPRCKTAQGGL